MMFERHSLKNGRVFCNRSGRYCNANVSVRIMESKTMKLIQRVTKAKKRVTKNSYLKKQRKASGNGEYNLIKYVGCHHHTRYEARF